MTDSSSAAAAPVVRIDLEAMRLLIANTYSQLQSRITVQSIRPLPVFLGLQSVAGSSEVESYTVSPSAFTSPSTTLDISCFGKIKHRIKVNGAYYLSNYALVAAMVAMVVALMHPGMILTVAAVQGLWWLHSCLLRREIVVFGISIQNLLTVQQRFYALFALTTFVIVFECLVPAVVWVFISSILICTHASLRNTKQLDDLLENESSSLNEPLFPSSSNKKQDDIEQANVKAVPY